MCYRGVKATAWRPNRLYCKLLSVFPFKSGRDWAGRCILARKQVIVSPNPVTDSLILQGFAVKLSTSSQQRLVLDVKT